MLKFNKIFLVDETICSKELAQIIWAIGVEASRKKLDSEMFSKELANIENHCFKAPLELVYNVEFKGLIITYFF